MRIRVRIMNKGTDAATVRYVRGHILQHSEESGHSVALSWSDMSVWCARPRVARGSATDDLPRDDFAT
jgi:hypothetical protein